MVSQASRPRGNALLPQPGEVPDPNGLVQGRGDQQVLRGVELGAHHVVVVTGQDTDALPRLPVPYSYCLWKKNSIFRLGGKKKTGRKDLDDIQYWSNSD